MNRFTPLFDDVEDTSKKGRAPLELDGYHVKDMPLYQYLTQPLLFNFEPAANLELCNKKRA